MELGIDLIKMASGMLPAIFGPGGNGAPGVMPASGTPGGPGGGQPGGGVTAQISPAIQTRISPQISPVFTQMQSSPGAGVVASPQQIAPGGQTATTPMGVPGGEPGAMMAPQPDYGYAPAPTSYGGPVPRAMQPTRGFEGINWTPIAVAGIVAIGAMAIFGKRRKRK